MAIYRTVQLSFWTDSKVVDDFTPEDRYFYLYLMTNPHTNLVGCYEVSIRQISAETGYSKDVVERLLDRMESIHQVILYSKDAKEVLILNWGKYNWTKSLDFQKALSKQIETIKTPEFRDFIKGSIEGLYRVYRGSHDTVETSVPVLISNNTLENDIDTIKEIIDYLNSKSFKNYRHTPDKTKKAIRARLNEGFTVEDFKKVIDIKCEEWLDDPKMNTYLRPETLFGTKFEGYLNQKKIKAKPPNSTFNNIENHTDWNDDFYKSLVDN